MNLFVITCTNLIFPSISIFWHIIPSYIHPWWHSHKIRLVGLLVSLFLLEKHWSLLTQIPVHVGLFILKKNKYQAYLKFVIWDTFLMKLDWCKKDSTRRLTYPWFNFPAWRQPYPVTVQKNRCHQNWYQLTEIGPLLTPPFPVPFLSKIRFAWWSYHYFPYDSEINFDPNPIRDKYLTGCFNSWEISISSVLI